MRGALIREPRFKLNGKQDMQRFVNKNLNLPDRIKSQVKYCCYNNDNNYYYYDNMIFSLTGCHPVAKPGEVMHVFLLTGLD